MSQRPISLSPDLSRLRDEGYEVEIRAGHLLINNVPYVNSAKEVRRGMLASKLDLAGDVTVPPANHVAMFCGEEPCHRDGRPITEIFNPGAGQHITPDLFMKYTFSAKPKSGRY